MASERHQGPATTSKGLQALADHSGKRKKEKKKINRKIKIHKNSIFFNYKNCPHHCQLCHVG